MAPTASQFKALDAVERVSSILSILGTSFIIVTFLTSRLFDKPVNRLVFFTSFANIFASIAGLIGRQGIAAGPDSALCQIQGLLIHWFMIVDPLFTLAMAFNVYLTVCRRYSGNQLRAMEWKYLLLCYGVPFVPSIIWPFIRNSSGVRVYGPATLWCSMSRQWDALRIATFYAPAWIVAIITMGIYIYVGIGIFRKRRQLREFSRTHSANNHPAQQSTMTTNEVRVTKEVVTSRHSRSLSRYAPAIDGHTIESDREPLELKRYSVTVDTGGNISQPQMTDIFPTHNHQPPTTTITPYQPQNDVAWTYTRAAVAYFIAMVVTWVPSSAYRLHGLIHPESQPFPFIFLAALVLPLQGFWNGLIYMLVSQRAVRVWFKELSSLFRKRWR